MRHAWFGLFVGCAIVGCNELLGNEHGTPLPAAVGGSAGAPSTGGGGTAAQGGGGSGAAGGSGGMGGAGGEAPMNDVLACTLELPNWGRTLASVPGGVVIGTTTEADEAWSWGGGEIPAAPTRDGLIIKMADDCSIEWVTPWGGAERAETDAVASHADGTLAMSGYFSGTAAAGPFPLVSTGGSDIVVAKLDAAGDFTWAVDFGHPGSQEWAVALAIEDGGDVLVGGEYGASLDINGVVLPQSANNEGFVARLAAVNGATVWATSFVSPSRTRVRTIAVADDGSIYAGGMYSGSLEVNGVATSLPTTGGRNGFVAKLTSAGDLSWVAPFESSGNDYVSRLVVRPNGNVVLLGRHRAELTIETTVVGHVGERDWFIAELNSDGELQRVRGFGGANGDRGTSIALEADGSLFVGGAFHGASNLGSGTVGTPSTRQSIFIANYDASANLQWARIAGNGQDWERVHEVAVGPAGTRYVGGWYWGLLSFGEPTTSPVVQGGFVSVLR